jgi:hypothetical protein
MVRASFVLVLVCACSDPPSPPARIEVRAEPDTPAPTEVEPAPTEPQQPQAPAASAPPNGDLPNCLWFADQREPDASGPRSLEALDAALSSALSRPAWVLGRVRGRSRGCPDVSVGLAIMNARSSDRDPAQHGYESLEDVYASTERIVGERGDERRTMPWVEDGSWDADDYRCGPYDNISDIVLFRAAHVEGRIENLKTAVLMSDRCGWLRHSLVLGDIDHDGRSEVRVEARTLLSTNEASEQDASHDLWLVDVATFAVELEVQLQNASERFMGDGYGNDDTRAELTFRDMDGDGHRDALVRGRSQGLDPSFTNGETDGIEYRDFFTRVHRYDALADRFVEQPRTTGDPAAGP